MLGSFRGTPENAETYIGGAVNLFWANPIMSITPGVPIDADAVERLGQLYFPGGRPRVIIFFLMCVSVSLSPAINPTPTIPRPPPLQVPFQQQKKQIAI